MVNEDSKTLEQLFDELEQAKKAYDIAKKLAEQKEKEEADRKKAELAAKKEARKKEVDDAIDRAIELLKAYTEDYGSFSITDRANDFSFLFGSKPWRLFF